MTTRIKKLRYYLYLSDAKVESFYRQIHPSPLDRILPDKLSLAVERFRLSLARKTATQNEYEKLETVLSVLENSEDVGTPWEPRPYFKGMLPMKWDTFSRERLYNDDSLVCFAYLKWAGHIAKAVILVGSSLHLIGNHRLPSDPLTEANISAFRKGYSHDFGEVARTVKYELARQSLEVAELFATQSEPKIEEMVSTLIVAADGLPEPVQNLSFFAKTLFAKRVFYKHSSRKFPIYVDFVLGTPFYVALAD